MTLIGAIITKTGEIVVGSDSQATMPRGVNLKRMNHSKLVVLKNQNMKIVLAGAGDVPFITKAIEEIQSASSNITTFADILQIAENSMLHLTRWFNFERPKELYPQKPTTNTPYTHNEQFATEFQSSVKPLNIILMLAGIDENRVPQIYVIHNIGLAEKQEGYGTIGSGSTHAESVLSKCFYPSISSEEAIKVLSYTVEEVMTLDPNVGGETSIARIKSSNIEFLSNEELSIITKETNEFQDIEEELLENYFKGTVTMKDLKDLINKSN